MKPKMKQKEIKKIYIGYNTKGQFVVDEDTKEGKYSVDERFSQFQYKINEIINALNELKESK